MAAQLNTIQFDETGDDYIIDGRGLKEILSAKKRYSGQMTLVKGQPHAPAILAGTEPADLENEYRALYVCDHCGGYDGTLIGVKIEFGSEFVIWSDFGIRPDHEDGYNEDFSEVPDFYFTKANYADFIRQIKDIHN